MLPARAPFIFLQMEFPWALGPADGRYLLRDGPDAEPERVVVLGTLGAARVPLGRPALRPPARALARSRRATRHARPGARADHARDRDRPGIPLAEMQARAWLEELDHEREVRAAARTLNRVLHAHRVAAATPTRMRSRPPRRWSSGPAGDGVSRLPTASGCMRASCRGSAPAPGQGAAVAGATARRCCARRNASRRCSAPETGRFCARSSRCVRAWTSTTSARRTRRWSSRRLRRRTARAAGARTARISRSALRSWKSCNRSSASRRARRSREPSRPRTRRVSSTHWAHGSGAPRSQRDWP